MNRNIIMGLIIPFIGFWMGILFKKVTYQIDK